MHTPHYKNLATMLLLLKINKQSTTTQDLSFQQQSMSLIEADWSDRFPWSDITATSY
jgi:hypothetical protein